MQPLQIKPQIELLGEEVRIVNSKVGTKTIGCCTSWITKTIVEQLGAQKVIGDFISFFVISQGFQGQNPKYKRSNVKGVG